MGATWQTYLVRPLLPGGAAEVSTAILVDAGDTLQRAVAKVGVAPATAWDDPAALLVELPLGDTPGDGSEQQVAFYGAAASAAAVVSFFAQTAQGGWIAGPVVQPVDLTAHYDSQFPWIKKLVIGLLQQLVAENPPALPTGRVLDIKGAFPRDTKALPRLTVQLSSCTPSEQVIGDSEASPLLRGQTARRTRGYTVTLDLLAWMPEPEMRDAVGQWLGGACMVLVETLEYFGVQNPTFTLQESEDFEVLGVPTFLVTGSFTGTVWTNLSFPVPTPVGHLELVQEAP